jgi:hypothetical protein
VVIEFQRSLYHGSTTNPTYNAYRTGINSVVLGQSVISRKSNAGGNGAKPFCAGIPAKKLRRVQTWTVTYFLNKGWFGPDIYNSRKIVLYHLGIL